MIVVDSSALLAVLRREQEADVSLRILAAAGVGRSYLSSVSLLEASMVLAGRDGDHGAWDGLDALIAWAGTQVVAQDAEQGEAARAAFLRYGKGRHPARLNLDDCASYALAKTRGLPLLYKGDDFPRPTSPPLPEGNPNPGKSASREASELEQRAEF